MGRDESAGGVGSVAGPALSVAGSSGRVTGWRGYVGRLVAAWLVVGAVATAAVGYAVHTGHAGLTESFEFRARLVGDGIAEHVSGHQVLAAARAVDLLADEMVSLDQLQTVATGLGFTIGAVFDDDGRLLVGLPYRADFVGRDFTGDLEHVRIAVAEGRPVVSQAVVSPAIETPVVALAAPYATPFGTRIVTGVFVLQGGVFSELLQDAVPLDATHVELIDRDGHIIAASANDLPAELTPLSELRPRVAAVLGERSSGEFVGSDGRPYRFTAVDIGETGWRLVASVDRAALFAPVATIDRVAVVAVILLGASGLLFTALLASQDRRRRLAEATTGELNAELNDRVARRTAQLETANDALQRALETAQAAEARAIRLATVVEAAGEAIIGSDVHGTISSWNPAAERLYGYPAEEIVGEPVVRLAEASSAAELAELHVRALAGERISGHEMFCMTRRGERRVVAVSVSPIIDGTGRVLGTAGVHRDLTVQREVELRERNAQALFASVFHSGGAPQAVTDMSGRFVQVNDAMCQLLGYTREELLRMTTVEVTDPADRRTTLDYLQRFVDGTERTVQVVKRYLHSDGRPVVVLASLTRVDDPDGAPAFVVAMVQDITERVADQERLAQREALLNGLTASSANILMLYDLNARCVFAAGAGLNAIGFAPEDVIGTSFYDAHGTNPDMVEAFRRTMSGEPTDLVAGFAERTYDVRFRAVRTAAAITHVAAAITDVSEHYEARQALAASERRFRALVQHASDVIVQVAIDGTTTYVSPGVEQLLGVAPERLVGRPALELVATGDAPIAAADLESIRAPGALVVGEVRVRSGSGELREVEYRAVNLLDDPAVGSYVVNLRDVTDRNRIDSERAIHALELETLNDQLRTAVHIREHILAATTHELRTPLTPLMGMLEVIRHRWDELDGAQLADYIEILDRNATRLGRLVEDLLFATRLQSGPITATPTTVRLADHVRAALRLWPETSDVVTEGDEVEVWCEAEHLDQILTNVIANAVKYGAAPYRVGIQRRTGVATVLVHDTGPGIPEELVDRLFEPFVQGSVGDQRTATGLGLGLAIARELARANGGELTYHAQGTAGATFALTLPTAEIAQPVEPAPRTASS